VTSLRAALVALALLLTPVVAAQSRLQVVLPEAPNSLDPAEARSASELLVVNQIYETLFRFTPEGALEGHLAADWSYATATRLRVRLTPGVSFSDGAPLDALAVQASLERLLERLRHEPGARLLEAVTSVEVQDALKVVIVTAEPYAPLMAHLAHPATAIVPGGHGRDLARGPIGSGAYELAEWLPDERIVLRANDDYRNSAPAVPEIEFRTEPDEDALIAGLSSGALHLAPGASGHVAHALKGNLIGETVTVAVLPGWSAVQLGVNAAHPKLASLNVRQALALAVDKNSLVESVPDGLAQPAVSALPPSVRLAPQGLDEPYPYEPDAARDLLAAEGLTDLTLTLDLVADPELEAVAEALAHMLAGVGVNLETRVLTASQYRAQLEDRDLQLFLTRWSTSTLDPDQTLYSALHSSAIPAGNASHYRVAAVDSLLAEARNSTSEVVRAADYLDVIETVLTDLPVISLYYPQVAVATGAALTLHGPAPAWFLIDLALATLAD
jgi:peptide/nickel transport system substrate-binding protein